MTASSPAAWSPVAPGEPPTLAPPTGAPLPPAPLATASRSSSGPAGSPSSPPARARRRLGSTRRRLTQASFILLAVAAVLFALAVQHAVTDSQQALETIGHDDTAGIRAAQRIKADLSEVDLIVTEELLRPTAAKGELPSRYNAKQKELIADLDAAGARITLGAAETVPLANLQYERAQHHALVREAVLTDQRGDHAAALELLARAHEVMAGPLGLLDQADALDKANTYALNQSYDEHQASSSTSRGLLVAAGVGLLATLVAVQLFLTIGFRRIVNLGLALASVVAFATFVVSAGGIASSRQNLTDAREKAFDPVHELSQARAAAYAARQAEAQGLADPGRRAEAQTSFESAVAQLYRVPNDSISLVDGARSGAVPVGSGGALARQIGVASLSPEAGAASKQALQRLGDYLRAHDDVALADGTRASSKTVDSFLATGDGDNGQAFGQLVSAIEGTLVIDEQIFDAKAQHAQRDLEGIAGTNVVALVVLLGLVSLGLRPRLREYGGA